MRSVVSLSKSIVVLAFALLSANPLSAQTQTPAPAVSDTLPTDDTVEPWEPLGAIPVDQAGAGRRGYVLPGESADVTRPGKGQLSFHTVAANNFYREETDGFLISQRFEAHTLAVGYRRGFTFGILPRVELGGQVQFNESDTGMLNGFISGVEDLWVSLSGHTASKMGLRLDKADPLPLGTRITKNGRSIYQTTGTGSGLGDFYFVAKALLLDGAAASRRPHVAARVALNVSGRSSAFTQGNFAGVGLSADQKVSEWLAMHGDVRVNMFLDRVSQLGLPLKRASLAFSAGPELKLTRRTTLSVQLDASDTPYLPTGTLAFDKAYGDVTLGLSHRFGRGQRYVIGQIYARENMNMPFRIRLNADPDLSVGIKATIESRN